MNKRITTRVVGITVIFICMLSCVCLAFMLDLPETTNIDNNATNEEASQQPSLDIADTTVVITAPTPQTKESYMTVNIGTPALIDITTTEAEKLVGFEVSDSEVVTVDDGGRVDALKEGKATVTATFNDKSKYVYNITAVPEQKSEYDGYSTCIIANSDIDNQNRQQLKQNLYMLEVNRKMNCVTAYTYDKDGNYTIPVRAMVCSCGLNDATILGSYDMYFKSEWLSLVGGVYGQYISGINGDYLFHSVPYISPNPDALETDEFNKLGDFASKGCIRMSVADTKWVYDNCPVGTRVRLFDDDNAGPLGKPDTIKITDMSCGWDPTDSNENNPYNYKTPTITGAENITISNGSGYNPINYVKAYDTCSNDITDKVKIIGNVITSRNGTYKVTYMVTDAMHRTAQQTITVTVE